MSYKAVKKVRVKVPASTANLGPGFDSLGMALNLYAWIDMAISEQTTIHLIGDQMNGIPTDKSNLIYKVAQMVFEQADVAHPELDIAMYSDIPLTRGLGSSASAIVGALAGANALIGNKLTQYELFQIASRLEKHPDNVGASLFGGIVVAFWDGEKAESIRIEPDDNLEVLVAIPAFQLSTEKARSVMPKQVAMKDAVFNLSHSSLLVAALSTGNLGMIRHAMKDALHQPYRAELIPGMKTLLEQAENHGALGVALSGAGPTMLALVDARSGQKEELEAFLKDTLAKEDIEAQTLWLKPSVEGVAAILLQEDDGDLLSFVKKEVLA
ncbi:homoserine kinase [Paenibacillus alginolyticus]|uniref:Homoserine kinase n=1 Tax=Paenibacillus alginolyticus TaxID=59839 RepID=A0ABT4GDJ4_9BACL|nr:homoserine kinase [Paenibacillus alginolyticus]MCY9663748.1 homoserine kinase [Paenibacillus alginolyticus]MCY9694259.1 homoserine kinase [Paenibacillus alginolyticus]MEC0142809.1 homoserine kinase [Paenibacillus alginolyticus]